MNLLSVSSFQHTWLSCVSLQANIAVLRNASVSGSVSVICRLSELNQELNLANIL